MHSFAVTFLIDILCVCIPSTPWIYLDWKHFFAWISMLFICSIFYDTSARKSHCLQFWYPHSVFHLIQLVKSSIFLLEKPIQEFYSITCYWYIWHSFISSQLYVLATIIFCMLTYSPVVFLLEFGREWQKMDFMEQYQLKSSIMLLKLWYLVSKVYNNFGIML